MQKRLSGAGRGAGLQQSNRALLTKTPPDFQLLDPIQRHRALVLIHDLGLRPELAMICATLAFEVSK